jgi:hypothetical protein
LPKFYQNTERIETTQIRFFRAVLVEVLLEDVKESDTAVMQGTTAVFGETEESQEEPEVRLLVPRLGF